MDADIGNLKTLFNEKAVEIENIKNSFDKIREFYEKDAFKEPADEICNESVQANPTQTCSSIPCAEELSNQTKLKHHMKTVHPVKYPCNVCWQMFETERGMKNHCRNVHDLT